LKKLQRDLSRKVKGSNGYAKAKLKIQKLHFLIAKQHGVIIHNQRAAIAHQLSDYLTKTFDRIVIENLNVKGMMKNRKLSRAIADVGWGMLWQFIEYKEILRNCIVVIADRFFPSSQLKLRFIPNPCSNCGEIKEILTLEDRIYECDVCGFTIDRDLNAAINLNNYSA